MSYLKVEHRVLNDPRVLGLSPAALVAHVYALDFCNEQATDGEIPSAVAHRMMCQLDPVEIVGAFRELVDAGLWEQTTDGYACPEFLAYGLPADEQRTTRDKWAQDKRRRRLHGIGNHALCTPQKCPAKAASGTESTPEVELNPANGGRPDPTRLDSTPKGSRRESEGPSLRAGAQAAGLRVVPADHDGSCICEVPGKVTIEGDCVACYGRAVTA
ncbi:hypothetical protein [Nocardioides sp. J54]|uniref:hypothetical protein n=1 Tax=Nocardioides sp. J54 TaxID=935866 RepID=UPI00048B5F45|nr:hypothetical protein [Nocardioides sp. J54]